MSEGSRLQIQQFLEKAYENSRNPDPREKMRKERQQKKLKVKKRFGL